VTVRQLELLAAGLVFEADVAGTPGSPLVLMLHGFPQTSHSWRHQLPALAAAGYFAVAPNQRGYSPHARPGRVDGYTTDQLVADARTMAKSLGYARYHLVGHDWGGQLSWLIAAQYPQDLQSLTVLSRPHPAAFARAMKADAAQAERSKHHRAFQDANAAHELLADGARRLRATLRNQGVPDGDVDAYLTRLGTFEALDAAINWYRAPRVASGALALPDVPALTVPTMYLWGDQDATVGRAAAEATADFVTGRYRFEVLKGVGHFITDQAPERTNELLLDWLTTSAAASKSKRP
jgi:pimeloyl-ACP methyl ester carboxylesterase